jgi:CheY-like chemotaxis protein
LQVQLLTVSRARKKTTVPYHKTILVVEDDPNDQTFILEAFRSIGVEAPIQVVDSGSEAVAYLKGEGKFSNRSNYAFPSFIMTDLNMLKGSGFFVLEKLRANPEWAIIPVAVLSNSENPDDIKKAYLLGANCYHHKPGSQAELCEQLQILHDYWLTCKVPGIDLTGPVEERFPQPSGGRQKLPK